MGRLGKKSILISEPSIFNIHSERTKPENGDEPATPRDSKLRERRNGILPTNEVGMGMMAPNFELEWHMFMKHSLSSYKGRRILLSFFRYEVLVWKLCIQDYTICDTNSPPSVLRRFAGWPYDVDNMKKMYAMMRKAGILVICIFRWVTWQLYEHCVFLHYICAWSSLMTCFTHITLPFPHKEHTRIYHTICIRGCGRWSIGFERQKRCCLQLIQGRQDDNDKTAFWKITYVSKLGKLQTLFQVEWNEGSQHGADAYTSWLLDQWRWYHCGYVQGIWCSQEPLYSIWSYRG